MLFSMCTTIISHLLGALFQFGAQGNRLVCLSHWSAPASNSYHHPTTVFSKINIISMSLRHLLQQNGLTIVFICISPRMVCRGRTKWFLHLDSCFYPHSCPNTLKLQVSFCSRRAERMCLHVMCRKKRPEFFFFPFSCAICQKASRSSAAATEAVCCSHRCTSTVSVGGGPTGLRRRANYWPVHQSSREVS